MSDRESVAGESPSPGSFPIVIRDGRVLTQPSGTRTPNPLVEGAGPWMQTFTGRQFFPGRPSQRAVCVEDIAHALSMICRYGGHTRRFYSVAEHCLLMSYAVPESHALQALLHDAAEAYVGDMVQPIKSLLPAYQMIERRILGTLSHRFQTPLVTTSKAVRDADLRILLDERDQLMAPPPAPWVVDGMEPLGVEIRGLQPVEAERLYLERLDELTGGLSS